jgi:hypothetical protein
MIANSMELELVLRRRVAASKNAPGDAKRGSFFAALWIILRDGRFAASLRMRS